jgi:tripartite-type tricarboxylate transporter receptor subunit TctC
MANVPDGAALIDNPISAAPGFRLGNVFVLAGVPVIMRAMFDGLVTATPHIRSGRMRLLAVTSEARARTFPEVPTTGEIIPGVVGAAWFGVSAPARLPAPIADRLEAEIRKLLALPDVQARLGDIGMTVVAGGQRDYIAHIQAENARYGPVIAAAKVKID